MAVIEIDPAGDLIVEITINNDPPTVAVDGRDVPQETAQFRVSKDVLKKAS